MGGFKGNTKDMTISPKDADRLMKCEIRGKRENTRDKIQESEGDREDVAEEEMKNEHSCSFVLSVHWSRCVSNEIHVRRV